MPSQIVNHAAKHNFANFKGVLQVLVETVDVDIRAAVHDIPMSYGRAAADSWNAPTQTEIEHAYYKARNALKRLDEATQKYEQILISRGWRV